MEYQGPPAPLPAGDLRRSPHLWGQGGQQQHSLFSRAPGDSAQHKRQRRDVPTWGWRAEAERALVPSVRSSIPCQSFSGAALGRSAAFSLKGEFRQREGSRG